MKAQILGKNGFTLIELVVVFSIMAVLGTVGIASFVSYSRSQALQQVTSDLITTINTAKANAVSQTKPDSCQNKSLNGYRVYLVLDSYKLQAICNGSVSVPDISSTSMPTNGVKFDPTMTLPMTITFSVISGGVTGAGTIILDGPTVGSKKTITVSAGGVIQ
jgi:prepilin-type N-terminal cleavage/methylation domain-containing protein